MSSVNSEEKPQASPGCPAEAHSLSEARTVPPSPLAAPVGFEGASLDSYPFLSLEGSGPHQSPPKVNVPGYEIVSELGRGGMGVVYKARQTCLNRVVAIKMILADAYAGPEEQARFRREAEAVARLQHPNIVQVYEIDEHEGRP